MSWFEEPRDPAFTEYALLVSVGLARDRSAWPIAIDNMARTFGFDVSAAVDIEAKIITDIFGRRDHAYIYCRVPNGEPMDG